MTLNGLFQIVMMVALVPLIILLGIAVVGEARNKDHGAVDTIHSHPLPYDTHPN